MSSSDDINPLRNEAPGSGAGEGRLGGLGLGGGGGGGGGGEGPAMAMATGPGNGPGTGATEPLACVSCRARKLKCDRTHPACARCVKVNAECVYPESRRKPAFKRRNVKELEARLAQVEVYLKESNRPNGTAPEESPVTADENVTSYQAFAFTDAQALVDNDDTFTSEQPRMPAQEDPIFGNQAPGQPNDYLNGGGELIGLGQKECLPPFEMMEELNTIFFSTSYHYVPVLHQGRYLQAFYSDPLRRPPMCLQYSIWALAAQKHEKYDSYADVFYKRARQYAEADELKGRGEDFLTLSHAQAWVLITSYESKGMLFTRASMSVARAVRLSNMLGLHRVDSDDPEVPPMLPRTASWSQKEERRRAFWGAFACDAHATIATGWPSLVQLNECMTRLPASEEAFRYDQHEVAPFLQDAYDGAPYSGFAGTIIFCSMFKTIMPHVHRTSPDDHPEDLMNGRFWTRHREIDNRLSSLFMFLPEKFRLPQNTRDQMAIHTNLNLHAGVICLHHAAIEMATKHNHPESVKQSSISRLRTAAEEIANIIKMTSHNQSVFKSPLAALSLYTATTVYIYVAKYQVDSLTPIDIANVEMIVHAMEAIGRVHKITRAFLQQVCLDMERHNMMTLFNNHRLLKYRELYGKPKSNIPLLVRSAISRETEHAGLIHSMGREANVDTDAEDLPCRLGPVNGNDERRDGQFESPEETAQREQAWQELQCFQPLRAVVNRNMEPPAPTAQTNHKRKRVSPSPTPDSASGRVMLGMRPLPRTADGYNQRASWSISDTGGAYGQTVTGSVAIPDRTNSTASSSPLNRNNGTETLSGSSHTSPGIGLGATAEENKVDLRPFIGRIPTPIWQATEETLFGQGDQADFPGGDLTDPWGNLHHGNMYSNNDGMLG